jgi:hypothetical protein
MIDALPLPLTISTSTAGLDATPPSHCTSTTPFEMSLFQLTYPRWRHTIHCFAHPADDATSSRACRRPESQETPLRPADLPYLAMSSHSLPMTRKPWDVSTWIGAEIQEDCCFGRSIAGKACKVQYERNKDPAR